MPVEVKGVIELRKALRAYAPDLGKELTKELGAALKPIVKEARSYMPTNDQVLSNWVSGGRGKFPVYDASIAKKGIVYKTTPSKPNKRGFRTTAGIYNKTPAGAIFETAGRKNPFGQPHNRNAGSKQYSRSFNPTAGRDFIASAERISQLEGTGKERGRAMFRAWDRDRGKTTVAVIRAIEKASAKFQARTQLGRVA